MVAEATPTPRLEEVGGAFLGEKLGPVRNNMLWDNYADTLGRDPTLAAEVRHFRNLTLRLAQKLINL